MGGQYIFHDKASVFKIACAGADGARARKLAAVGIDTPDKLREAGSTEAFFRLKVVFPEICLVHLYALEGAIVLTWVFRELSVQSGVSRAISSSRRDLVITREGLAMSRRRMAYSVRVSRTSIGTANRETGRMR